MAERYVISEAFNNLRRLNEADDDYIKIGNKVYPKNLSGVKSTVSPEEAQQIARDRQAQTQRKMSDMQKKGADMLRKNRLMAQAKPIIDKLKSETADMDYDDKNEVYFHELVPQRGKADSVAGELLRAINKICYRWNNDGDIFFIGYGLETAGASATYLYDYFSQSDESRISEELIDIANGDGDEYDYEETINNINNEILDYIDSHLELIATPNDVDSIEGFTSEMWEEYSKTDETVYETLPFDEYDNEDLYYNMTSDLEYMMYDCSVEIGRDWVEVSDINKDEFEEVENRVWEIINDYEEQYEEWKESQEEEEYDEEDDEDDLDESLTESSRSRHFEPSYSSRYRISSFYDGNFRGLANREDANNFSDAQSIAHDMLERGECVIVKDWETGREIRITPDEYDHMGLEEFMFESFRKPSRPTKRHKRK